MSRPGRVTAVFALAVGAYLVWGCSPSSHRKQADKVASDIIRQKQQQTLGHTQPFTIERPADTLRRRLMIDQGLAHYDAASLGTRSLPKIEHWPEKDYPYNTTAPADPLAARVDAAPLRLSLLDALQVAAGNSREYQSRKESIFLEALDLDLARDEFRPFFTGGATGTITRDLSGDRDVTGAVVSPQAGVSQKFANGAVISLNIVLDLAKLLTRNHSFSSGLAGDASITLPLLRGAGEYVVTEPLTQAERNVAYALLNFEQYKRSFAVDIASQYLSVLQRFDMLVNAEDAYRRLIVSAQRSRALAQAGRLPPFQMDQAISDELSARESWIASQAIYSDAVDSFKVLLGLPPDARIDLDYPELGRLALSTEQMLKARAAATQSAAATQPATRPIAPDELEAKLRAMPRPSEVVLERPNPDEAGRFEFPEETAVRLAMENRPDLRVARGAVYDAQRRVTVAANALQAGLKLSAGASAGERRGIGSTDLPSAQFRPEKGSYSAGFDLDLPLERTAERNAYRASYIAMEQAVRSFQQLEDEIKLSIRNRLTELLQAREALKTQSQALIVAERRVTSTNMLFEAGRVQVRDVLDAESALTRARNALTAALIRYRVAELAIERDLGVLQVNQEGLWSEYNPR